jgi:two-component system, cell cycle sensor histidine kinase PleC
MAPFDAPMTRMADAHMPTLPEAGAADGTAGPAGRGRLARARSALARFFAQPSRQVAVAVGVFAFSIVVHFGASQWEAYQDAIERGERDTRSIAAILSEHAVRTFDGVEETLRAVARLRADAARGIYRSQASIYVNLKTLRGGSPLLREIGWVDQYGERVASSDSPDPPRVSVAHRDFFHALSELGGRGLYVSPPVRVPGEGWRLTVAVRLENLDGSFAGAAIGTIDPDAFAKVYRTAEFAPNLAVTLFRYDSRILATTLMPHTLLGRSADQSVLFQQHLPQALSGSYHATRSVDGVPVVASYTRLDGTTGIVINVSIPRAEALAEFARNFRTDALQAILSLLVLVIGGPLLVRTLRRRERLEMELTAALSIANAQRIAAEQASKSKSAFLANMSHELRTPLNAVIGFSEMMAMKIKGPLGHPDYETYVSDIRKSGVHLLGIISDVLDVARIEAGKAVIHKQEVSIAAVADEVTTIMAPLVQRARVTLAVEIEPQAPTIRADARALRQILLNLVSNAVKFTPEGGAITVRFGRAPGGGAQLSVNDTGIGIPAAEIPKLMQPFTMVHDVYQRKFQGAGLGLTLVRSLAELHGGTVAIESTPGHGTTVTVTLPESRLVAAG